MENQPTSVAGTISRSGSGVFDRFGNTVKVGIFIGAVFAFHIQLNFILNLGKFRRMNFENIEIFFTPDKTLSEVS